MYYLSKRSYYVAKKMEEKILGKLYLRSGGKKVGYLSKEQFTELIEYLKSKNLDVKNIKKLNAEEQQKAYKYMTQVIAAYIDSKAKISNGLKKKKKFSEKKANLGLSKRMLRFSQYKLTTREEKEIGEIYTQQGGLGESGPGYLNKEEFESLINLLQNKGISFSKLFSYDRDNDTEEKKVKKTYDYITGIISAYIKNNKDIESLEEEKPFLPIKPKKSSVRLSKRMTI